MSYQWYGAKIGYSSRWHLKRHILKVPRYRREIDSGYIHLSTGVPSGSKYWQFKIGAGGRMVGPMWSSSKGKKQNIKLRQVNTIECDKGEQTTTIEHNL